MARVGRVTGNPNSGVDAAWVDVKRIATQVEDRVGTVAVATPPAKPSLACEVLAIDPSPQGIPTQTPQLITPSSVQYPYA